MRRCRCSKQWFRGTEWVHGAVASRDPRIRSIAAIPLYASTPISAADAVGTHAVNAEHASDAADATGTANAILPTAAVEVRG